jgi:hypothetical protein
MPRVFDNTNSLKRNTIEDRLYSLDQSATAHTYFLTIDGSGTKYVIVDSTLTDAQIIGILSTAPTIAEQTADEKLLSSRASAAAIPNWASWTEAEAQTWGSTNIGTPLTTGRANLPATLTLATTRAAIVALLDILDKMWVMMWAMARLLIALRDKNFPNL